MPAKKKNIILLIIGFLMHTAALVLKCMDISDNRTITICLSFLQYAGMFSYLSAIHYFGTTYQYEKYPEESQEALIEKNDERTATIHNLAKARAFDVMVYVLIILPFLLFDIKADLSGIIGAGAALVIMGVSYAYFLIKYSKDM